MDEYITEETAESILKAFKDMNKSLEDSSKAFASTTESTIKHIVAMLILRESTMLVKLAESSFITRWYYKRKYRKAKYGKIIIERFYNQNLK